jgi:hypothetical protein
MIQILYQKYKDLKGQDKTKRAGELVGSVK